MEPSWSERVERVGSEGTYGRVLIVDDDTVSARTMARVLERAGYALDIATSGAGALTRLAATPYDVVVTDLLMPGVSGAQLIWESSRRNPSRAFVVVSGAANLNAELAHLAEGQVVAAMTKPWDAAELVDAVGRAAQVHANRSGIGLQDALRAVLVIEDDGGQAAALERALSALGTAPVLVVAASLATALDALAQQTFDLVLADLSVPDARGVDVVRRVALAQPRVPIIALIEGADDDLGVQALELGASEYLCKRELGTDRLRPLIMSAFVRSRERRRLEDLAFRDGLTGLSNARHLRDRLSLAIARAQRHRGTCALLFIDLDGFKLVNDWHGHDAGDRVLQTIARRIDEETRNGDTLARLGGDEFAILLEDIASRDVLVAIIERLIEVISQPIDLHTFTCQVSASVGVAECPETGDSAETLLRAADMSMYDAKRRGPGRYVFASGATARPRLERARLHDALRQAVRAGELALAFQPQLAMKGRRVIALEALMRWRRDRRNVVPPAEFIPQLEEMELVHSVGMWAIETACAQLPHWAQRGKPLDRVAVNASPRQFEHPEFAERVLALLNRLGTPPAQLELEVTERVLMRETVCVTRNLATLRESGVRIAVDDFGTGFASLNYLRSFRVDSVKIDQSFVAPLGTEPGARALVAGIIDLGHRLGIEVVAEGVETLAQLRVLRELGCDVVQGFLLGKPVFTSTAPRVRRRHLSERPRGLGQEGAQREAGDSTQ